MRAASNAASAPGRSRRLLRVAAGVAGCALALVMGGTARAGEKITITGSTNDLALPKESGQSLLPTAPNLFRSTITPGEPSLGPVVPAPGQPNIIRNQKLEEFMDRKQNWIFQSPDTFDRDTLDEIFGVRKYDSDVFPKKPKSTMERRFEASDPDTKTRTKHDRKDRLGSDTLNGAGEFNPRTRSSALENLEGDRDMIPELNPAYLFNPGAVPDSFTQVSGGGRNSILPPGLGDPNFGRNLPGQPPAPADAPDRRQDRSWEIQRAPLGRMVDPINDPIDPTRSILNPIAARKPTVPAPSSTTPAAGAFSSTLPSSTRPDFFGPSATRPAALPGYAPPIIAPASAPVFQPKPAVLEIPRPRI